MSDTEHRPTEHRPTEHRPTPAQELSHETVYGAAEPPSAREPRRGATGPSRSSAGDAVYCLGLIGALVFFWQQADGFWDHVVAVLKALVWPAFLIYQAFSSLKG